MLSFSSQNDKKIFCPTDQVYSKKQTRVTANQHLSLASATSPKRYNQKFSKLIWDKIARRHLLKF